MLWPAKHSRCYDYAAAFPFGMHQFPVVKGTQAHARPTPYASTVH